MCLALLISSTKLLQYKPWIQISAHDGSSKATAVSSAARKALKTHNPHRIPPSHQCTATWRVNASSMDKPNEVSSKRSERLMGTEVICRVVLSEACEELQELARCRSCSVQPNPNRCKVVQSSAKPCQ